MFVSRPSTKVIRAPIVSTEVFLVTIDDFSVGKGKRKIDLCHTAVNNYIPGSLTLGFLFKLIGIRDDMVEF